MITNINSVAGLQNPHFQEVKRAKETNIKWLEAHRDLIGDGMPICLVGGWTHTHFPLRVAQAGIRHDRTPSNWSHVFIFDRFSSDLRESLDLSKETVWGVALDSPQGLQYPPLSNGLQSSLFARYSDPEEYPNIALFALPIGSKQSPELDRALEPRERFENAISGFRSGRSVDVPGLLLRWLGYSWGVGPNPLDEGFGMPSAALVEEIALELDSDLTPGLESRASCPEAIWQAARWWHEYYEGVGHQPLKGAWSTPQRLVLEGTPRDRRRKRRSSRKKDTV